MIARVSGIRDGRAGSVSQALARARHARASVLAGRARALVVARIEDDAELFGRFASEAGPLRRQTGGPPWHLRPGVTFVHLSLAHPSVLLPTPPDKILNRNVRPLLAALRKAGALAMYGGRDFVSADGEIVALLGWARGRGGEIVLEAAIATDAGVMLEPEPPEIARAHLGKRGRVVHLPGLREAIVAGFAVDAEDVALDDGPEHPRAPAGPVIGAVEVAIGRLALHASSDGPKLFGDLLADDALDDLDLAAIAALPFAQRRAALAGSGCVIEGVRDWPDAIASLLERS